MNKLKTLVFVIFCGLLIQVPGSCIDHSNSVPKKETEKNFPSAKSNPVVYFEIPVTEIDRAIKFYSIVFKCQFDKDTIDKNEMALFPFEVESPGISGALAKGDIYKPTKEGVIIYFNTENIDETLKLAITNGAKLLYPKTDNGIGLVAEFEDTEGNRIALYQQKQ